MRLIHLISQRFIAKEKGNTNALYLIDFKRHTSGNHFGPWLKWYAQEFVRRFDRVIVVTPDKKLTKKLFKNINNEDIQLKKIPRKLQTIFDLNHLAHCFGKTTERAYFFVMWANDIEKLAHPIELPPWATVLFTSRITRVPNIEGAELEKRILNLATSLGNFKGYFELDHYIPKPHPLAVPLLDLENVDLVEDSTPLLQQLQQFSKDTLTIGAFGNLTGPRCLDALMPLVIQNPNVNFALIGKIRAKKLATKTAQQLEGDLPKNLFLHPEFINNEQELNTLIAAVDAIFIDGSHYPQHSGIALKAIHFSKCIISPKANAWVCDLIQQEGVGFTYTQPSSELLKNWEVWHNSDGPNKSSATAKESRNLASVAKCFDQITAQLKSDLSKP